MEVLVNVDWETTERGDEYLDSDSGEGPNNFRV